MNNFIVSTPLKNGLLALGMMVFLALSFKLAGDLTSDNTVQNTFVSATDTVVSTLQIPDPH